MPHTGSRFGWSCRSTGTWATGLTLLWRIGPTATPVVLSAGAGEWLYVYSFGVVVSNNLPVGADHYQSYNVRLGAPKSSTNKFTSLQIYIGGNLVHKK